jgi:thiol-disulfide isomerase/thioredoxin
MKKKRWIWIIVGTAGAVACLFACAAGYVLYQLGSSYTQAARGAALVGNRGLPDGPVFLCFGTTWCPDCKKEAPLLQKLHEQHPEVTVLWIDSNEEPAKVEQFLVEEQLTFHTLLDQDGNVARQYMIWAVPTVFVVDAHGIIQARFVEQLTQEQIDATLSDLGIAP